MVLRLITTKLLIIVSMSVCFSQGQMVFTEESFDFGNVTEGTMATHEFQFVNKGSETIVISNVQASCGCTTPFWTREPIKPGNKGVIKASYNSKGRPGAFTKTITITSNAQSSSKVLTIKGIVVAKPLISPSSHAKFEATSFNLGKVVLGKRFEKIINVTNDGNAPLSFVAMKSGCNCINSNALPDEIQPGQKTELKLTYLPRQLGNFSEPVSIITNDKNTPEIRIFFRATVEEDESMNSIVKESKTTIPFN